MNLDLQLFSFLHNLDGQNPLLDQIIFFVGEYLIWILGFFFLISIFLHYRKNTPTTRHLPALALATAVIANVCVSFTLKMLIHRPRPFQYLSIHHLINDNTFAFPSGHTTFMFALATAVYAYNKKLAWLLYATSLLIGLARITGGVHWPTDILGGALTGLLVGWLFRKFLFPKAQKLLNWKFPISIKIDHQNPGKKN